MSVLSFWVIGDPVGLHGLGIRQGRPAKPHVDARLKLWRESIEWGAMHARSADPSPQGYPLDGPVAVVLWFWLPMSDTMRAEWKRTGVRPLLRGGKYDAVITGYAQVVLDGLYDVLLGALTQVAVLVAGRGYCIENEDPAVQIQVYSGKDVYAYAVSTPPVPADRPAIPAGTAPARRGPYGHRRTRHLPGETVGARPPLYWFDGVRLCRRLDTDE